MSLDSDQGSHIILYCLQNACCSNLPLAPPLGGLGVSSNKTPVTWPRDFLDFEEEPPYQTWISQPPVLLIHEVLSLWWCWGEGSDSQYQLNFVHIITAIFQKLRYSRQSQPRPGVWGLMELEGKVGKWDRQKNAHLRTSWMWPRDTCPPGSISGGGSALCMLML